jgi:hypothetical protein
VLRLDHGPAATLKLDGELLGRHSAHRLLYGRQPFRRIGSDRVTPIDLCLLQPVDKRSGLVASELAGGLTLCEPHWATRVSKVGVTGFLDERQ